MNFEQFTFRKMLEYETEQCLHCRLSRYYSRRDPLHVHSEAAAKLAEDLRAIGNNVKKHILNPGTISALLHFNHISSIKQLI